MVTSTSINPHSATGVHRGSKVVTRGRRAWTLAEGLALTLLTLDVARKGRLTRWEERRVRAPLRFPPAATLLSRAGAAGTLQSAVVLSAVVNERGGFPLLYPTLRVLGAVWLRAASARVLKRERPPQERWREVPDGFSYPSRHTTNALLLTRLALDHAPGRITTTAYWTVAVLVGGSRLRLGVHWPTDVLGAALAVDLWWRLTSHLDTPSRALDPGR